MIHDGVCYGTYWQSYHLTEIHAETLYTGSGMNGVNNGQVQK